MARVLLTGATGQLGPAVLKALREQGHVVTLLARRPMPGAGCPVVMVGGAWTAQTLRPALDDMPLDAIVNLAAAGVRPGEISSAELHDVNVVLPSLLIRLTTGRCRAFVGLGSAAEYAGDRDGSPLAEDAPLTTTNPYGLSKAAGGLAGKLAADQAGLAYAHLRLFGVYGEHEAPHRLLPTLVRSLEAGEAAALSDGAQIRDWLYEEDVGSAVAACLDGLLAGSTPPGLYNLGSGQPRTVRAFAERTADILKAPKALLRFGAIERRTGEAAALLCDPTRLRQATGWAPAYDLEAGLALAIARLESVRG